MMNKKTQAALEFLTTYGWAIMVVMIMVGALAYFGVLNPTQLLPERCSFGVELNCEDHVIYSSGNVNISIRNNFQDAITINSFNVTTDTGCSCSNSYSLLLPSGDKTILGADCSSCTFIEEEKIKVDASINYIKQGGAFPHTQKGEIFATVMP